jgi:hypothetical protein
VLSKRLCIVVAVVDHIAVVAIGISVSACNIIVPAVKTAILVWSCPPLPSVSQRHSAIERRRWGQAPESP